MQPDVDDDTRSLFLMMQQSGDCNVSSAIHCFDVRNTKAANCACNVLGLLHSARSSALFKMIEKGLDDGEKLSLGLVIKRQINE